MFSPESFLIGGSVVSAGVAVAAAALKYWKSRQTEERAGSRLIRIENGDGVVLQIDTTRISREEMHTLIDTLARVGPEKPSIARQ